MSLWKSTWCRCVTSFCFIYLFLIFFKNLNRLLSLFVVANLFGLSLCVPPIYTPALLNNVLDRDGLVANYFNLGFTYKEIGFF